MMQRSNGYADDRMVFEGYLNKDGYITEMRTDGEAITWYDYDDEGHLREERP